MEENILADIPREGTSLDKFLDDQRANSDEQENESPAVSPAEEGDGTDTSPSPDGGSTDGAENPPADNSQDESKLPFHKHPRWKAMHDENAALKQSLQEFMQSQRQVLERIAPPQVQAPQQEQIPEWFVKAYGDDPQVWEAHQTFMREQREAIKNDLLREQQEMQMRQTQEAQAQEKWVDDSLAAVEQSYGVKLQPGESTTNEFIKFVIDFKPTDNEGNLDLVNGWKLFQEMRKPQEQAKQAASQARKSLASSTMSTDKGNAGTKTKDFFTPADFKNKGWKGF